MRIHDPSGAGVNSAATRRTDDLPQIGSVPARSSALRHGLRLALWLGYFCIFYQSGLALTTWIVEPAGSLDAMGVVMALLFPVIVAGFPRVNRFFLRASGKCGEGGCGI